MLDPQTSARTHFGMRLTNDLAANRCLYHRVMPTMPDLMVIDIPAPYAAPSLALGRYYPIILETNAELGEIEAFLAAPRTELTAPDILDRRPSAVQSDCAIIARYAPPARGWPWLLLCWWPADFTALANSDEDVFAREAYTCDAFATLDDLLEMESRIRISLLDRGLHQISGVPRGSGSA